MFSLISKTSFRTKQPLSQNLSHFEMNQIKRIKNNKYQRERLLKLRHQKSFLIDLMRKSDYNVELEKEDADWNQVHGGESVLHQLLCSLEGSMEAE